MAAPALTGILLARADTAPDSVAYETPGPAGEILSLSYAQVAARATALASELADRGTGPVLLAYPAGLDYAVGMFAGFLAGRPVIPAYPPGAWLPDRARLEGIVADAGPEVAIAPEHHPVLAMPATLAVPGAEADAVPWRLPRAASAQDVAIIQYTSGSTGRPRGVLVRHESLAANIHAIADVFELTASSRGLTWLPPFHDMGLVGGLLTPVAAGIPVRILPPSDFLKSPLSWLRQITESGATASGAPDFAYQLCVRRVRSPEQLDGLDLSRWQVAFNGGETVRLRTLVEFAETFAPVGFRPQAFLPCYGLAEATLMVSAGHWSGRADTAGPAVSCGAPVAGQQVVVVDPERRVPADGEGEIWISGPHVTHGYLSGSSAEMFGELDGIRYLRTGDLGRLRDGELILTGRVKDVIVSRGVNYHAVDVEAAALEEAGPAGRTAAAFGVESGPDPMPVLVLEVRGHPDQAFAARIRAAVLARTGLRLGLVALVGPRSIPRTSSGKVRRSACRDALAAGAFADAVCSGDIAAGSLAMADGCAASGPADEGARNAATAELTALIDGVAAGVCDVDDCQPDTTLADLGLDSVRAAEAAAVLEHALGLTVPLDVVLGAATPREVAGALVSGWADAGVPPRQVIERVLTVAADAGGG
jgi:acyl-CoA synthetase (AMP-forming)/AMP-acid ligase II/acyl carrier protein